MSNIHRAGVLSAAAISALLLPLAAPGVRAQSTPAKTTRPAAKTDPAAKPASASTIITIDSVGGTTLAPVMNHQIKVKGIIGDFIGDKTRYWFHTNDQANVQVVGSYPDAAHVTYSLTARVGREGSNYILYETGKEMIGSGGEGKSIKADPLLLTGGALILAALVTFFIMMARAKAERQRQEMEQRIDEERRRADAARADAERAKSVAGRG
jgi:hypothetical protein